MTTGSYFAFARHALVAGLQHLGIQPGDEIGIPELICRDVLASIAEVGAKAQFYPVDQALRPTGCGTAGSARAVLMVNYFGFPQQIADFTGLWPQTPLFPKAFPKTKTTCHICPLDGLDGPHPKNI